MNIIVSPTDNIDSPYERTDKVSNIKGIDNSIPDMVSIDVNEPV